MSDYVDPKERRRRNRQGIYRIPEVVRLVPPLPPEESMTTFTTPTPRRVIWPLYLVLAAAAALALAGGATLFSGCQTGGGTPAIERIDRTVDCLKDRLPMQAIGYLDVVTTCLVGGNYMACLAPLAEKAGRDVIACAVAQAGSEAHARASSAGPGELPNQDNIAVHARAYLEADGARTKIE